MKIVQVSPYDYPYAGGVQQHIYYLRKHLEAMGHEVHVLAASSASEDELQDHIIRVSETIIPFPFSGSIVRVGISPRVYWRVKQILEKYQFDIIHLHEPLVPPLSLVVLRHAQTVTVGTFHAYRESHAIYEWGKLVFQPFFDRLDGKIAVSQAARSNVARYFPGEYTIIPNGVEFDQFANSHLIPPEPFDDGRPNILFVGRLEKRKGFKYLLAAYQQVKAVIPDVRLLVVGKYGKEDVAPFQAIVAEKNLADVCFLGYVTNEELPRYYRAADVCCVPSIGFESFGIVLLEAMASGTPLVASDIPGYREVVTSDREGILVPPRDVDALACALIHLLKNPVRRRQMAAAGQDTARRYRWEYVAQQVADYYKALLMEQDRLSLAEGSTNRRWREFGARMAGWLESTMEEEWRDQ